MKIIAWHLPQFHQIPENDEWWGEGFTEWTNVKKAQPLYKGHNQPRIPLNNYYYNLLDKQTMQWQCELSQKYNVYGFCYYHYWFNGKLLLEKPVENLLTWTDIPQKFCLSWANEPWIRSWTNKEDEVLYPQSYGGEEDWKKHFDYLLPFFKDERYIRIDDKPVFVIYRTQSIENCDKMLDYFYHCAVENGLDGLYFIETLNFYQVNSHSKKSDAVVWMEPMASINQINKSRISKINSMNPFSRFVFKALRKLRGVKPNFIEYKEIIDTISSRQTGKNPIKHEYFSAFLDWDNTARKKKKSTIVESATPDKFADQLNMLTSKSNEDIIFINAWNEWAEGTYLEPDTKYGYQYLEKVKELVDKQRK